MSFGFSVGDFIAVLQLANDTRKQFVDAPNQFKAISDDVKNLSTVLRDIDDVLPKRDLTSQQQTELGDIISRCRSILQDLDKTLDKFKELDGSAKGIDGKARRIWKKFKWDQKDFDEFRNRIGSNILLLSTFLGRISGQAVFATRDGVERLHERQDTQERQQEHKVILDWLTPIDYAPQQSDFINRRQAGTGQWLLDSKIFKKWAAIPKQDIENQDGQELVNQSELTMFCPGIPGVGKTILTSIVVEEIDKRFQNDPDTGIAYLYCNFRRRDEQKAEDLLASLLQQLARKQSPLSDSVKDLYQRHHNNRTRPSLDEISKTLYSVITTYSRVYIIIDALDECQISDGCRSRLLSNVFDLQAKTKAKLFATSRPIPDIKREFKGCLSLEILASDEDIQRYLKGHMLQLPAFVLSRPELQDEIKTEIAKAVEGMFLLAQLYLGSLEDKTTAKAMKIALQQFQKHSQGRDKSNKLEVLSKAYDQAMERINGQKAGFQLLAKKVLSWIICARRPLTTLELQHAIAVEIDEIELDKDNLPEIEDIVSVCAGLVTIDEESNIIRLVHYTTQEYFERTQKRWFPNAATDILNTCLTYLSFDTFETGSCATGKEFEVRLQENALFDYAARNWGYHAQKASTESILLILSFFESNSKLSASTQAMLASKLYSSDSNYSQRVPKQMVGVHVAAYFGLQEVMRNLIETNLDLNIKDSSSQTPLSWAARYGHEAVVKLLLATGGVETDSKDKSGQTPLSWAAWNGHEAVVKLLLATGGVEADSKDESGQTPLSWAARKGHEAIVKLLLATGGVEADSKDKSGQTPLSVAAEYGHEAIVKLLLATGGVEANSKDESGQTPLSWAARYGHEAVVKLLLATGGVEADLKDEYDRTPLSWAARKGHEAVVKLLLATGGVEADSKDKSGQTPLSWAARKGHEAIVKLLLATGGVEADLKDEYGRAPLSWAAWNGHEAVVKLLLATRGVDANSKDNISRTPLFYAAQNGHKNLLGLLLTDSGIESDNTDHYSSTPLSIAVRNGREEMVKILLAIEYVALDSRDSFGRTPIWWSRRRGYSKIEKLLAENAQSKGIIISENDLPQIRDSMPHDESWGCCDVCTLTILRSDIYYKCGVCNAGDFDICFECFEIGAHCLSDSHKLLKAHDGEVVKV